MSVLQLVCRAHSEKNSVVSVWALSWGGGGGRGEGGVNFAFIFEQVGA